VSAFKIATTGKVARSRFAVFIASSVFGSALVVDLHSSIQFNDASEEFNTVSPHSTQPVSVRCRLDWSESVWSGI